MTANKQKYHINHALIVMAMCCCSLLLAHVSKTGATSWKVYQRTDLETLEDLQVAYMTSIAHMKLLNPVLKDMALPADLQLSALCEQLQSQWSGGSRPVLPADALKSIKPAQFDVSAPWLKVARNHKFGRDLSMSVLEGLKSDEIGMCDLHGNKQLTLKVTSFGAVECCTSAYAPDVTTFAILLQVNCRVNMSYCSVLLPAEQH